MDINQRVRHIKFLVSEILFKLNAVLNGPGSESRDLKYITPLHQEVSDFDDEITNFEQGQLQSLNKDYYPEKLNDLLMQYLDLLDSLFYTLLVREGGVNVGLVSKILAAFQVILKALSDKSHSAPKVEEFSHYIIQLRIELEREVHLFLTHDVQTNVNRKIDAEFDRVRNDHNKEINALSSQYSLARESLLGSIEKYKSSIDEIMKDATSGFRNHEREIIDFLTEIENKKDEVIKKYNDAESYSKMAKGLLERSSQNGMAAAFQSRHDKLFWPMLIWAVLFFMCLASLIIINSTKIIDVIMLAKVVDRQSDYFYQLMLKVSTSLPLIWGAWFSAKQYTHSSRLREDYAYKVAIAMTYHGYKDEANNIDEKMGGKLLDTIVTQFSDNPVRLYQGNNHASIFEAMIKNDKVSDLMNAAQKLKQ